MSGAEIMSKDEVNAYLKGIGGGPVDTDRLGRVEPEAKTPQPADGGLESIMRKAAEVLALDSVASVALDLVMEGKRLNLRICKR